MKGRCPIDFNLYLITDRHQVPADRTLIDTIQAALEGGARAVQLREKDLPAADLVQLAEQLRILTSRYDARLLINDRIDIALAVEADGVHLGGHSLPTDRARQLLGPGRLIGVSTHSPTEIRQAEQYGADFVTFGPVFATPSKRRYGAPQGLESLQEVCKETSLPVFALGGITTDRQSDVLRAGAAGIALISAIITAPDPTRATHAFLT